MNKGFKNPIERAQAEIDAMTGQQNTPAETPEMVSEPAATVEPVITPHAPTHMEDPNGETFKARWETLQGMYRTSQDQVQVLSGKVASLESHIASLVRQTEENRTQTPSGDVGDLVNRLCDEIGGDTAQLIRQLIRAEFDSGIKPVAEQVNTVVADNTKTRQGRFEEALTTKVSDWRNHINTANFGQWLQSNYEPVTGLSYLDCFERANNSWNLDGLANIFIRYKEAHGLAGQPQTAPVQTQSPAATDPRASLVTPGRSGGSTPAGNSQQDRIFRISEVNQFYKDVAIGKYRGREQEAAVMEAAIYQANQAGRVVAG